MKSFVVDKATTRIEDVWLGSIGGLKCTLFRMANASKDGLALTPETGPTRSVTGQGLGRLVVFGSLTVNRTLTTLSKKLSQAILAIINTSLGSLKQRKLWRQRCQQPRRK